MSAVQDGQVYTTRMNQVHITTMDQVYTTRIDQEQPWCPSFSPPTKGVGLIWTSFYLVAFLIPPTKGIGGHCSRAQDYINLPNSHF